MEINSADGLYSSEQYCYDSEDATSCEQITRTESSDGLTTTTVSEYYDEDGYLNRWTSSYTCTTTECDAGTSCYDAEYYDEGTLITIDETCSDFWTGDCVTDADGDGEADECGDCYYDEYGDV